MKTHIMTKIMILEDSIDSLKALKAIVESVKKFKIGLEKSHKVC